VAPARHTAVHPRQPRSRLVPAPIRRSPRTLQCRLGMSGDFVHLHLHTQYSLLDGANRVKDLIHKVKASGMDAVAVTDHGNMFGAYDLQTTALEAGVKPILGVEAYVAPGSRFDRESVRTFDGEGNNYHLTLLVETPDGYRNLARLVSEAFLSGFYYRPRMDWELLEKHHEGLIALSGCLNGEVARRLRAGDYAGAKKTALRYRDLFGKDRYFIEIMDHGLPEQRQILPDLLRLSQETGIPPVATNDSHYLTRDDAAAQDVLLCIGTGKTLTDAKRMKFYNSEFYVKSPEEMSDVFRPYTLEAVRNTAAIADRVTPSVIVDTGLKIPTYPVPVADRNPDEYLEELAKAGLEERLAHPAAYPAGSKPPKTRAEYDERLSWELSVILKMGLSSYFLIVWDFIKYAKDEGIPVGPGRGSAAGSLVAWSLGITDVDPLRYDLLFERFLNPDRISMPDIDVDLCERRRGEVIEYVRRKYGRENVGQIITFNSMKARAVIRDVGRVLDVPLAEVNRLCSLIPANPGRPTTLAEARRDVKELAEALRDNETYRRLFDLGERLEGVSRHAGVHAAGVLIAPKPLVEYLPLYRNSNDEITTQFEMKSVDRMGLLKMDFLGLITLTILDDALGFVEKRTGVRPDLSEIPLDDPEVYRLFAEGRTDGVFQFESSGMRDLLRRVKPEVFDDLAALNALYRPGALDAGTVEVYIERRRGRKFDYPLPQLEPILKETYGILVYQEQVMLAARAVAGYSPGEADKLRKAIGKKDDALLKAEGDKFMKKAAAAGTPKKKAEELWALILPFGRYGFNKSHSVVYALLAYRTAWMKLGRRREVRQHVPGDEDPRAPAGREQVRAVLHARRRLDPVRPRRRQGCRRRRRGVGPRRAPGGRALPLAHGLLLARRPPAQQQARDRGAREVGLLRLARKDAGRPPRRARPGDRRRRRGPGGRDVRAEPPLRRPEGRAGRGPLRGQARVERGREDPLREGDARVLHHGPPPRALRGRDPDVRRRDLRDSSRKARRAGQARGPRVLDQEEPDQEGPERREDDGEGRRRGPDGLRSRHRLREPPRADPRLARPGQARPRDRNGALGDAGRGERRGFRTRKRERVDPDRGHRAGDPAARGDEGAGRAARRGRPFELRHVRREVPRRDSQKVPRFDAGLSRDAPRRPIRGAAQTLVGILGPSDAGLHGVDGDPPRPGLRPLRLRAAAMTSLAAGRGPGAEELRLFLARIGEAADRREMAIWLVGGALRDLLLGRETKDVDLAVEAGPAVALELARRLSALPGWSLEARHERFGTATLAAPGGIRVDLAATRREEYPAPGALPVITGTATIEDDLGRRDFTIHAMARRIGRHGLVGTTLDPFGGKADLAAKTLRLLHPKSLADDPTRAYRAVKYAVRLGFAWEKEFEKALKAARSAGAFQALSGDRMRRGIEEVLSEGKWEEATGLASGLQLFGDVLSGWAGPSSPSRKSSSADSVAAASVDARVPVDSRPKPEEIWRRLLEPLPPPERAAAAARLNFSRALRRAAGVA